ncbi:Glycosyltransferase [Melia azedarach]|uniref:Glycosyltransferase n=1 Tax=Melia azedarach TaxID=155640 RepID=A0ACC1YKH8_MELAZ|nr:Glycosyltransferase [Melia azedarach]
MDAQANQQLHFALFPFMAQGHMIPMIDIAKLLAQRGVIITIFTTPLNAARFEVTLARAIESGLQIQILRLQFPCVELGLQEGCENLDMVPSLDLAPNFFRAADMLQDQVEKLFGEIKPQPNCIISDHCLPYTVHIASKFNIPRISFFGLGCFCILCYKNIFSSKVLESINSESEYFAVPGLPDKVEFNRQQVDSLGSAMKAIQQKMAAAEQASYGVIVNSFEELEQDYVKEYKKMKEDRVWCVGPVSLHNKEYSDKAERGNRASVDEQKCVSLLDSRNPGSVIYACLGSLCNLIPSQMIELGLGLEASKRPFIWVIRDGETSKELRKWSLEDGFEERVKGRGLVIWGWAPQVLILSHPSVGGFLTHCGWNSTLEGISAGLPLLTWPLFGDQFINEKLIVQILKTGVRVGAEKPMKWGEEQSVGVLIKRDDVKNAVEKLMDEGKEGEERRASARELGKLAKMAVQEGGSSHHNITLLLEDIMKQEYSKNQPIEESNNQCRRFE